MKLKDVFATIDEIQEFVVEIMLPEQYWKAVGSGAKTAKIFPSKHNYIALINTTREQQHDLEDMEVKAIRMDKFYMNGIEHIVMRLILSENQKMEKNAVAG